MTQNIWFWCDKCFYSEFKPSPNFKFIVERMSIYNAPWKLLPPCEKCKKKTLEGDCMFCVQTLPNIDEDDQFRGKLQGLLRKYAQLHPGEITLPCEKHNRLPCSVCEVSGLSNNPTSERRASQ